MIRLDEKPELHTPGHVPPDLEKWRDEFFELRGWKTPNLDGQQATKGLKTVDKELTKEGKKKGLLDRGEQLKAFLEMNLVGLRGANEKVGGVKNSGYKKWTRGIDLMLKPLERELGGGTGFSGKALERLETVDKTLDSAILAYQNSNIEKGDSKVRNSKILALRKRKECLQELLKLDKRRAEFLEEGAPQDESIKRLLVKGGLGDQMRGIYQTKWDPGKKPIAMKGISQSLGKRNASEIEALLTAMSADPGGDQDPGALKLAASKTLATLVEDGGRDGAVQILSKGLDLDLLNKTASFAIETVPDPLADALVEAHAGKTQELERMCEELVRYELKNTKTGTQPMRAKQLAGRLMKAYVFSGNTAKRIDDTFNVKDLKQGGKTRETLSEEPEGDTAILEQDRLIEQVRSSVDSIFDGLLTVPLEDELLTCCGIIYKQSKGTDWPHRPLLGGFVLLRVILPYLLMAAGSSPYAAFVTGLVQLVANQASDIKKNVAQDKFKKFRAGWDKKMDEFYDRLEYLIDEGGFGG